MASKRSSAVWQKTKSSSKAGFDKVWGWADKLGGPVNRLSNKVGSEAFWPTTLDKESDKAARILKSFCKDGFYQEETTQPEDGPKQKQRVIKRIPAEVIKNAKGLAIFTTMRTGLWISGAGGSGVLVARRPDGSWSQPSGIMLHTAGLGFLIGVDIYDCVVVINTEKALEAFAKLRMTLGGEMSAVAGPVGIGGVVDTEVHKRQAPLFTYLKSRGFYAGVQIDGTIVIERTDANAEYYGQEETLVTDILAGKVPEQEGSKRLMATLRAAQGDVDIDESLIPEGASPGDFEIENESHVFGIPDKDDPDPYGVLALQDQGLEIREAGSKTRAPLELFHFRPSPSSPVFEAFNRRSMDTMGTSRRSSWRTSTLSNLGQNLHRSSGMVDMAVQTDDDSGSNYTSITNPASVTAEEESGPPALPPRNRRSLISPTFAPTSEPIPETDAPAASAPSSPPSRPQEAFISSSTSTQELPDSSADIVTSADASTLMEIRAKPASVDSLPQIIEPEAKSITQSEPESRTQPEPKSSADSKPTTESTDPVPTPTLDSDPDSDVSDSDSKSDSGHEPDLSTPTDEAAIIHEVHQATAPQIIRARLVDVPKRPVPKLPPRSPARNDRASAVASPIPTSPPLPADSERLNAASIRQSLSTEDEDEEGDFIDAASDLSPSSASSGAERAGSSRSSGRRSVESASEEEAMGLHALKVTQFGESGKVSETQ